MRIKLGGIITAVAVVFLIVLGFMFYSKVSPGYVGVEYSTNGGVTGDVKDQGWHLMAPFHKVMEYPVSTETVYLTADEREGSKEDESFKVSTRDGKPVDVGVVYSYHFDSEKTPDIYTRFRGKSATELQAGYIKDRLYKTIQEVTSKEGVLDVYGEKRSSINKDVYDAFKKDLADDGIIIETFNFTQILPDAETMKSIQATVDAKQELKRIELQKERAKKEAEKRKIEAQGKAEAKLIEAQAEAEANREIADSISPVLVQYKEIQKWDGKRSKVVGGDALVDVREDKK